MQSEIWELQGTIGFSRGVMWAILLEAPTRQPEGRIG
jgi:hypothetical protein